MLFLFSSCAVTQETTAQTSDAQEESAAAISYSFSENTADQTIKLGYDSSTSLNPFYVTSNLNYYLLPLMYQSLYKVDSLYSPYEELATGAVIDGVTVTVTVRDDILFSDGTSLSATDVLYSFTLASDSDLYEENLENIISAEANGNTIIFTLENEDPYVLNILDFPIVKNGTASSSSDVPTGSGAYKISGDSLVYNSYYNGSVPQIGTIELYAVQDSSTFSFLLENGSVDAVFDDLSTGAYSGSSSSSCTVTLNNLVFIGLNSSNSALSLPAVRRAISYAVNRTEIADNAFSGFAQEAYTPFNPSWIEYFNCDYDETELYLDYTTASSLLSSSGYSVCYLTLIVNESSTFKVNAAESIAESLAEANIIVTIEELNTSEYAAALESGDYDMYIGEIKFPDNMDLSALFSTSSVAYGISSSSESIEAYEQYEAGEISMEEFIEIFSADMPIVPLCYRYGVFLYSRSILTAVESTYDNVFSNITSWELSS